MCKAEAGSIITVVVKIELMEPPSGNAVTEEPCICASGLIASSSQTIKQHMRGRGSGRSSGGVPRGLTWPLNMAPD